MDWGMVGAIGEIVGAVAVVASLVFLRTARVGILDGKAGLADLGEDERTKAVLHFAAAIRIFETIHRQVEAAMPSPDAYEMMGGLMFRTPLFGNVWKRLRGAYSPDFARVMETRFGVAGHVDPTP